MKLNRVLSFLLLFPIMATAWAANDYTQYVNPWIGTGGHGHVFLGANVPWGYVQLGPTENTRGWDWCSGYHISDSVLIGFGHQHLSGTGIGDLGDFAFLPVARSGQRDIIFSHGAETVTPGYYAISLHDPNVFVELTATKRCGFHRYTYSPTTPVCRLAIDLKQGIGWDSMTKAGLEQVDATTLKGYRMSKGWAVDQRDYFYVRFSKSVTMTALDSARWEFTFSNGNEPLLVKVGLSAVSEDNARLNLEKEIPGWDFNGCVAQARQQWNDELSKIQIETPDANARTIFYTAMYHTMTAPSVFNDVNGDYRGADGKIHKGDFQNYTTFSLWDTYRSAHPLMTLIHPDMLSDIGETLINICRQQGKLPVWHLMGCETDCMVGNPGVIVLGDLVLKGKVKDPKAAFEAMKKSCMLDERGMDLLKQYGYLPYDKNQSIETVSKTLEYAIADDAVARVAKMLGYNADYKYFYNRSKSYRKLFDSKLQFMRGRSADGKFREPFNPFHAAHEQDDYTEGNAWQYTWLVPQDPHGLVSLFGSEASFVNKLDSLFFVEGDMGAEASPDISGLIGQYAQGNEPSHHVIYFYDYVGQPWKAAKLLRRTFSEMYRNDPDGLCGNEDVGAMSAWYVLSSMGLYQVEPASGKYVFGTPLFDKATLNVGNGRTFTIKATNNSDKNMYVQRVLLNGKNYTRSYINYNDITRGGTLEFVMGAKPSKFGSAKKDRP
ncbi:MAG: GH92 family glycosyl hydrolase [Prevotella sp.]|nr:GH92 family glycosyl hydrolase [Prevotella sp.]